MNAGSQRGFASITAIGKRRRLIAVLLRNTSEKMPVPIVLTAMKSTSRRMPMCIGWLARSSLYLRAMKLTSSRASRLTLLVPAAALSGLGLLTLTSDARADGFSAFGRSPITKTISPSAAQPMQGASAPQTAAQPPSLPAAAAPTGVQEQTLADGSQVVTVPAGCTAVTAQGGQLVIVCPSDAQVPGVAPPVQPPQAPMIYAPPPGAGADSGTRWYGWQTIMVDAGWMLSAGLTSGINRGEVSATIAVGGYLLGAPILHAAHGNWPSAGISLGLRTTLPLAGAFTGLALTSRGNNWDGLAGFGIGGALGMIGAMVIDAAALSTESGSRTTAKNTHKSPFQVLPSVAIAPKQQTVGLQGTF